MDIEIITLCDFAQDVNGKLTIVGTFDTLFATKLPAHHPNCHLAVRMRFQPGENGKIPLVIKITSPNGEDLIKPVQVEFQVPTNPITDSVTRNICLGIGMLPVNVYGKHTITISAKGNDIKSIPFFIAKPQQATA